jgi:hypothetical protein
MLLRAAEGEIALVTLLRRFPQPRLAAEPPVWLDNPSFRGLQAFPLLLTP